MTNATLLTRVELNNYRSIRACDVSFGPLTFLVGPNGSGKSNFLDALRFVSDALCTSLDHALRDRGGINEVRRRSGGHPTHLTIILELTAPPDTAGFYAFYVGSLAHGRFSIIDEVCHIWTTSPLGTNKAHFSVRNGKVTDTSAKVAPPASSDRLYLVNAAGLPEFRPVYDLLSRMGFHNLNPDRIRDWQPPDAGTLLARDGANITSVLKRLRGEDPGTMQRMEEYLAQVVPGVRGVEVKNVGPRETLEFRQAVPGAKNPWRFPASSMSDGTLRALGILAALFQSHGREGRVPLVGIEEPEAALHPAAVGVLLDALREASQSTQVIVTSHSPDLLDDSEISDDQILAVVAEDGETKIGPLDETGRSALRDRLYTAGELLRLGQLRPDPSATNGKEPSLRPTSMDRS